MTLSHVVGFDDAPFERSWRGNVLVVGAVFAGSRLEGVLSCQVRRDGANATTELVRTLSESRFAAHLQCILLQGIAFAGFNVVDIHALHHELTIPVVVVARKAPDLQRIQDALLTSVRGGKRKWALIEKAGPMEAIENVYVQRAGIDLETTSELIRRFSFNGQLPEPLRTAHLIAGGVTRGESRHRA